MFTKVGSTCGWMPVQFVGNIRKAVHQIEKRESEAAEAAEAVEQEKILKVSPHTFASQYLELRGI